MVDKSFCPNETKNHIIKDKFILEYNYKSYFNAKNNWISITKFENHTFAK